MSEHDNNEPVKPARKPYEKPVLSRWGSLQKLTLGGTGKDSKDGTGSVPKTKFGK